MALVIASNLRKELSGAPLFDGVSFKIERRDRLALAGSNGAGKTTLLRMLAGELSLDGGELAVQKGMRVALHDQRPPAASSQALGDYVLGGTADLAAVERELRELEAAMAAGAHDRRTMARYADAQERLEHAGGYDWRERALSVPRGLGFSAADLERPLSSFSGGELTRASLARALAAQPDLLLLDEPTNHLDIDTIEWLEELLESLDAGVILVAHDRWFLESVTTGVLELDRGRSLFFPGNWHLWRREQAARAQFAARTAARDAASIDRLERFVERFGAKATKASQARSKRRQIERLRANLVESRPPPSRLGFEFLTPKRSGRVVIEVEGLRLEAGGRVLLQDASFALERGEHVSLVGANGCGKTTLIETILGLRAPAAGTVRLGHGVEPAYFSQHEADLDERGSVLEAAIAATGLRRPEAQKLLGRFLFSGWEEHEKPVAALSGGERRRSGAGDAGRRRRPTSCSSTSPPTTSTWRAARPSSWRWRRSRARCCWSPTTAHCSTPSPVGCWRSSRSVWCPTPAAGPSTDGPTTRRTHRPPRPGHRDSGPARLRRPGPSTRSSPWSARSHAPRGA